MTYDNRVDFDRFLAEYHLDRDMVERVVRNESDQVPMPVEFDAAVVRESEIDGRGLFATRDIAAGEMIAPARLRYMRTPAGRYTNHSMQPNGRFVFVDPSRLNLMAKSNIAKGEEITIDYRQACEVNGLGLQGDPIQIEMTRCLRAAAGV